MRIVLDASVAVAAMRTSEPAHAPARQRSERAVQYLDELLLPPVFPAEVGGALARLGTAPTGIHRLIEALVRPPHKIVTVGPKAAAAAQALATSARLRGADALYVWLAASRGATLCTLDQEMLQRAAAFCHAVPA